MTWTYRLIVGLLRMVVHVYFRQVDVSGLENIPAKGGGILVAWHPNGLIDPGLILTHLPRQVVFGARSGLFSVPLLGTLMRAIGTVPIYRAQDGGDAGRRDANLKSLDALAAEVVRGSFSCLFPEGTSHDASHPVEIKTGAARFYYQARAQMGPDAKPPLLIPVGLHYDGKRHFRSSAHVVYHPPLELPPELDVTPPADEPPDVARDRAKALTAEIDRALHETAHATDTWETHFLLRRIRKIVRAERAVEAGANPGRPGMTERTLGFARVRQGYLHLLEHQPSLVEALRTRVADYDRDMRALRLEDHDLDHAPRLPASVLALTLIAQVITVYLLFPPLLLVGYLVNGPAALLLLAATPALATYKKDETTLKVLLGMVLFPVSWVLAGLLAWYGRVQIEALFPRLPEAGVLVGVTVAWLGAAGGYVALRYLEITQETARAVRIRFTRRNQRETLDRLRAERHDLYTQVMSLSEGLELPGRIDEAGRVVPG